MPVNLQFIRPLNTANIKYPTCARKNKAIPLLNIIGSPSILDKNQSPAIENKKAPKINQVSFEGFTFLKLRIIKMIIPIPAVPDLNIKLEVIKAIIADKTENINST